MCKLCQRQPGHCPTHNVDLSKRNAKVAASAKANDPRAFIKQRSMAGKKGYRALVKAGKEDIASEKAAQYRLENPSSLEQILITTLDELSISYQREVKIDRFYADFVIDNLVVEVNGYWVHSQRTEHDKGKYKTFRDYGFSVLVLSEKDVITGKFREYLARKIQ